MRKKRRLRKPLIFILILLVLAVIGSGVFLYISMKNNETTPYYLAGEEKTVTVFDKEGNTIEIPRGTLVEIRSSKAKIDETEYCRFDYEGKEYYILEEELCEDRRYCVRETEVYALRDHVLTAAFDDFHITGWVKKKDLLQISSYHELLEDGTVDFYEIAGQGYISAEYVAQEYYETAYDASIYSDVFSGMAGSATMIDYYPKQIPSFADNVMPDQVNALYINAEAIIDAEEYIRIAKMTPGINAFVVDIKDCYVDTQLAYRSPVGMEYAPSTENIPNSFETYKENVGKLKDAGYYLIGRITAFKDDAFAYDNPEESLSENGQPYTYGYVRWPSVFSRRMWEYDMALAMEAVDEFGFNEIQFDYIRFPEDADETIDLRNTYDETRAQGVTNFLRYATEFLHRKGVYVSADVFGETSGTDDDEFSCFVAYYGQFWPAVSNAVDVISSMPYPDHFGSDYYGIAEPWNEPGRLMYAWGRATAFAQEKTYDPAKCRTWIMAQNSDVYDVVYGPDFVADQIKGLRDAGVCDGYMTWNAASSFTKYSQYADVLD